MCCCSIYYNYRGAIDLLNLIIIIVNIFCNYSQPNMIFTFNQRNFICYAAECSQGCENGATCIIPGVCLCQEGWFGRRCEKGN